MASNVAINPDGEFSTLLALVLVSFNIGAELDPPRTYAKHPEESAHLSESLACCCFHCG